MANANTIAGWRDLYGLHMGGSGTVKGAWLNPSTGADAIASDLGEAPSADHRLTRTGSGAWDETNTSWLTHDDMKPGRYPARPFYVDATVRWPLA